MKMRPAYICSEHDKNKTYKTQQKTFRLGRFAALCMYSIKVWQAFLKGGFFMTPSPKGE